MTLKQAIRDRVRVMNKHFTNKLMIHIAGKRFGHFAVLTHAGRKSGRRYRIPVIAEPAGDGFVFALTYGRKVDWAENVLAAGGCELVWKEREYRLCDPRYVPPEEGLAAFPAVLRGALRRLGIGDYLMLTIADA